MNVRSASSNTNGAAIAARLGKQADRQDKM
jgi:hypothetical protein